METVGATFKLPEDIFGRKRVLRLMPDCLEYANRGSTSEKVTRVKKEDIVDIRYSADWNIWYRFYVGCTYLIEVKTKHDEVLQIKFSGYFGAIDKYGTIYDSIVDLLWEYYLKDIIHEHLHKLQLSGEQCLAGVAVTEEGVAVVDKSLIIGWQDVELKEYETYFMVYSKQQPELNQAVSHGEWGSEVLRSMIRTIKQKRA